MSNAHLRVARTQSMLIIACDIVLTQKLDNSKISHNNNDKSQPINIAVAELVISFAIFTTAFLFTMTQIPTTIKIGPTSLTIKFNVSII